FQLSPSLPYTHYISLIRHNIPIACSRICLRDHRQVWLSHRHLLVQALLELIGRLILLTGITKAGCPLQQSAVDLANSADSRPTLNLRQSSLFFAPDLFTRQETSKETS